MLAPLTYGARMAGEDHDHIIAAREAEVRGDGPRLEPLAVADLNPDLRALVEGMVQLNAALQSRDPLDHILDGPGASRPESDFVAALNALPEITRTMLRHPDLFARQTEIGIQLLARGALPPRERELAIMRVGWLCGAPYEWGEHAIIAKTVGVTSADIERVIQGPDAPGWSERERAVLRAVEELFDDSMISDETWAVLAAHFNDKQLIELPILIGQYQTVAYYQNALRLRLHDGNPGLKAR